MHKNIKTERMSMISWGWMGKLWAASSMGVSFDLSSDARATHRSQLHHLPEYLPCLLSFSSSLWILEQKRVCSQSIHKKSLIKEDYAVNYRKATGEKTALFFIYMNQNHFNDKKKEHENFDTVFGLWGVTEAQAGILGLLTAVVIKNHWIEVLNPLSLTL